MKTDAQINNDTTSSLKKSLVSIELANSRKQYHELLKAYEELQ